MSIVRPVRHLFALAVLSSCLGIASPVLAERLGPMTVLSDRNQPFEAEVEFEEVRPDFPPAGTPQVVSPATYADLGLAYPPLLRDATLTVVRRPSDGRWVGRLRAKRPADASALIVVMSLATPSGRHLRSYRIDPDAPPAQGAATPPPMPVATAPGAAPTSPPPAGSGVGPPAAVVVEPVRGEATPIETRAEPAPAPAPALPSVSTPVAASALAPPARPVITVARGDTATSLARSVKPADVTDAQAALALYRNNPAAFNGSVHRPRPGATLVVPSPDQMRALPAPIAAASMRARPASTGSAAPIAARKAGDRLELSAGGTGRGKKLDGSGGATRDIAFDAALNEARSRIAQLEAIVAGLEKLIAERERQIGELAESMRVIGLPVAAAGTPALPGPAAAAGSAATGGIAPPELSPPLPPAAQPVAASVETMPAASATMLAEPTRSRVRAAEPEFQPDPWWMDPMVLGAGGGVAVLLGALAVMRRRNAPGQLIRSRRPSAA
jgi:pilus assembly protein FimV